MSFASDIKKELTTIDNDVCCLTAELAVLIQMNGVLTASKHQVTLDIQTENAAIARRIYKLIRSMYDHPIDLLVRKKMKLRKNNVYIVRLVRYVIQFLETLDIVHKKKEISHNIPPTYLEKTCCRKAYLRGAFLAGGSINNPETSSYHLEIFNYFAQHNENLCDLLNSFDLRARILKRRNGYIAYIKEAEKITEFLIIIGAHNALFKFEDVRIVRDMRNSVNRLVNCETANLNKTIGAAFRHIENIKYIDETIGLDALPKRLQEMAYVRLKHQEATLKELGELIESGPISKSGVNHRLKRIDDIAKKIRNGQYTST